MKRVLLFGLSALVLAASASDSYAQPQLGAWSVNYVPSRLVVNTPAVIAGPKSSTNSYSNSWGADPATTPVVNMQVSRIQPDTLGCTTPTTSLTGKAALIYRGTCNFSVKAYNAQLQGAAAVIIVNNVAGEPVGMGSGTNANLVTIPVFMVSQADGNAMNAQLIAGQTVTVTYSRWASGQANDLGITPNSIAKYHAGAIPYSQLATGNNNPLAYRHYVGAFVGNFGTATQSNIRLRARTSFTPTSGAATVIRTDSVVVASFAAADSIKDAQFVSTTSFSHNPSSTGRYDTRYELVANAADQNPSDNVDSISMYVTDSVFSKARYNISNGTLNFTGALRFAATTVTSMTWGPMFYVGRSNYRAAMVQFSAAKVPVATGDVDLNGTPDVNITLYRWRDGANGNPTDNVIQGSELRPVGSGIKSFGTGDSSYENYTAMLTDFSDDTKPAIMTDSGWYWIAITSDNATQFLAYDRYNYYTRAYAASKATPALQEFWGPQVNAGDLTIDTTSADTLRSFPFTYQSYWSIDSVPYAFTNVASPAGENYTPAAALHISKQPVQVTIGVASHGQSAFSALELFPNPATTTLNVRFDLAAKAERVTFHVLNSLGQSVRRHTLEDIKSGQASISTAGLAPGQYYLTIGANGKSVGRPFTVQGK